MYESICVCMETGSKWKHKQTLKETYIVSFFLSFSLPTQHITLKIFPNIFSSEIIFYRFPINFRSRRPPLKQSCVISRGRIIDLDSREWLELTATSMCLHDEKPQFIRFRESLGFVECFLSRKNKREKAALSYRPQPRLVLVRTKSSFDRCVCFRSLRNRVATLEILFCLS